MASILLPELWPGRAPTAAADVYAATVVLVESLTGEPPYWEDTDLERLRRRHEFEDVDMAEVPSALHDVARAGMAKSASERMSAAALLDLVETAAIAGYGRDWQDRGREGVIQRVRSGSLPFGGELVTGAGGDGRDTEDAANDDYYADAATTADNPEAASGKSPTTGESRSSDQSPATDDSPPGPPSRDAADEAVMAAAAEIVAFASCATRPRPTPSWQRRLTRTSRKRKKARSRRSSGCCFSMRNCPSRPRRRHRIPSMAPWVRQPPLSTHRTRPPTPPRLLSELRPLPSSVRPPKARRLPKARPVPVPRLLPE